MVLHAITEKFRCAHAEAFLFLPWTGRLFLNCFQQNKQSLDKVEIPCGPKCLQILIFVISPAIRKNKFPQKNTEDIFPAKLYSKVNNSYSNLSSLHKTTVLRHRVCSITTCLFHSACTMNYWFYTRYPLTGGDYYFFPQKGSDYFKRCSQLEVVPLNILFYLPLK